MKIESKAGPTLASENNANSASSAQAARERAIAMLTKSAPQAQNNSAPAPAEVMIAQASENRSQPAEVSGQKYPNEATTSAPEAPAKAAEPSSKPEEAPISSQYAILARKEKAYRAKVQAQEAAFKAKEQAIAERESAIKAKDSEYQNNYISKDKLTQDTITTLLEAGISYDQITQMMLQQPQNQDPVLKAEINALKAQIQTLKGETEENKKSFVKGQEDAYKNAVNQIRLDVKSMVNNDPEFEAIVATNSVDDVVELIEKTYAEDGILLSNEDAAKQVEQELVSRISKYAQLSKIQQKNQTQNTKASPKAAVQPETQAKQPQPAKTLTNNLGGARQLSVRERAILAFQGKLGK